MSLRDQIAAKQRRQAEVPIQITDPTKDHEAWVGIATALELARQREDNAAEVERLEAQLAEAHERLQANWTTITLLALPGDDWEAAMHQWQGEDEVNWSEALAPLLAASCEDPELRDAQWWQEQLSRPEWSEGDIAVLRMGLLQLNVSVLEPRAPKG